MILKKTRSPSHTIIGAMHSSSVLHVVIKKKPAPRKPRGRKFQATKAEKSKKRNLARGKKQRAGKIVVEEPTIEYVEVEKVESKDTATAHFVKFMNELLDIMDMDERLKGN